MKRFYYAVVSLYAAASVTASIYLFFTEGTFGLFRGLISLLFLLIPPAMRAVFRLKRCYSSEAAILIFCFLAFTLGVSLSWYRKIGIYDLVAHAISGVLFTAIGMGAFLYLRRDKTRPIDDDGLVATAFSFCFSALVAVIWEIGEFIYFLITGIDVQYSAATGVFDTMEDMIVCLVGSLIMAAIMIRRLYFKKKSVLFRPVEDFYETNIRIK